jgi:hypothetical protein
VYSKMPKVRWNTIMLF